MIERSQEVVHFGRHSAHHRTTIAQVEAREFLEPAADEQKRKQYSAYKSDGWTTYSHAVCECTTVTPAMFGSAICNKAVETFDRPLRTSASGRLSKITTMLVMTKHTAARGHTVCFNRAPSTIPAPNCYHKTAYPSSATGTRQTRHPAPVLCGVFETHTRNRSCP